MFAVMILLCKVYNSTLLLPILASDILLLNSANVLIMVTSYWVIPYHFNKFFDMTFSNLDETWYMGSPTRHM